MTTDLSVGERHINNRLTVVGWFVGVLHGTRRGLGRAAAQLRMYNDDDDDV